VLFVVIKLFLIALLFVECAIKRSIGNGCATTTESTTLLFAGDWAVTKYCCLPQATAPFAPKVTPAFPDQIACNKPAGHISALELRGIV